jgi:uncharacterized membrane protein (DUF4010 family)
VAVTATFILAQRRALHLFLEKLKWVELRAALLLLVMTFVLLPVLPNRTIDPWSAINPHQLWLLTILTAGVSYAGYVAVKLAGARNGLLYAGALGGLVSSTTVTWTFARSAKQRIYGTREAASGVLASWAISLVRMTSIAIALAPSLMIPLGAPVAGAVLALVASAALLYRFTGPDGPEAKLALSDPFDLWLILRFTALLAVIMVVAEWLSGLYGQGSLLGLAAVSGLADVDPITLSTAETVGTRLTASYGSAIILVAAGANLTAKCVLAIFFGGIRFAMTLIAAGSCAAVTAAVILVFHPIAG